MITHPSRKITFWYNQVQFQLEPEPFKKIRAEITQVHTWRKAINAATLSRFESLWLRNITQNTRAIIRSEGVQKLFSSGKDLPAVIIGAGPSLAINLEVLKKNKDRAILIAVDTVYKTLIQHAIHPDFVVIVDPQKVNSKYVENVHPREETFFIAEPAVCAKAIRDKGAQLFMFDTIFPYYQYLCKYLGYKGEIELGGSVATTALDFSRKLEFKQIALCGMDLSYRKDSYHVPGTMYEEQWFSQVKRFHNLERMTYDLMDYEKLERLEGINGSAVYVDAKFTMFVNWINEKLKAWKDHDSVFYQCSEAGHPLEYAQALPLHLFFEQFGSLCQEKKKSFMQKVRLLARERTPGPLLDLKEGLSHITTNIERYQTKVAEAILITQRALKKKDAAKIITKEMIDLDRIDRELKKDFEGKSFINIVLQKVIHEITGRTKLPGRLP